jgi:hypothetical protein
MENIQINTADYETLVNALGPQKRLGKRDVRNGFSTQTANHPEYGPVVLVMDMLQGSGMMIGRKDQLSV